MTSPLTPCYLSACRFFNPLFGGRVRHAADDQARFVPDRCRRYPRASSCRPRLLRCLTGTPRRSRSPRRGACPRLSSCRRRCTRKRPRRTCLRARTGISPGRPRGLLRPAILRGLSSTFGRSLRTSSQAVPVVGLQRRRSAAFLVLSCRCCCIRFESCFCELEVPGVGSGQPHGAAGGSSRPFGLLALPPLYRRFAAPSVAQPVDFFQPVSFELHDITEHASIEFPARQVPVRLVRR